jgi:hypothetical protein
LESLVNAGKHNAKARNRSAPARLAMAQRACASTAHVQLLSAPAISVYKLFSAAELVRLLSSAPAEPDRQPTAALDSAAMHRARVLNATVSEASSQLVVATLGDAMRGGHPVELRGSEAIRDAAHAVLSLFDRSLRLQMQNTTPNQGPMYRHPVFVLSQDELDALAAGRSPRLPLHNLDAVDASATALLPKLLAHLLSPLKHHLVPFLEEATAHALGLPSGSLHRSLFLQRLVVHHYPERTPAALFLTRRVPPITRPEPCKFDASAGPSHVQCSAR